MPMKAQSTGLRPEGRKPCFAGAVTAISYGFSPQELLFMSNTRMSTCCTTPCVRGFQESSKEQLAADRLFDAAAMERAHQAMTQTVIDWRVSV